MRKHWQCALSVAVFTLSSQIFAAQLIDLKSQPSSILQAFSGARLAGVSNNDTSVKEINRYTDVNHVTHVRMQEYYRNYPIWNAHAVIHIPQTKATLNALLTSTKDNTSMNGHLYQKLNDDLAKAPAGVYTEEYAQRALQFATNNYQTKHAKQNIQVKNAKTQLQVYVDSQQAAHWVFQVSFNVPTPIGTLPAKPVYLIDAVTLTIYKTWDNIKTEWVQGGGLGGNTLRPLVYDGLPGHSSSFTVNREANICKMQNPEASVEKLIDDENTEILSYPCPNADPQHNNLFWSANFDQANGGYSPANDAMFAAQIIKKLYQEWYQVPALVKKDGSDMVLTMLVHLPKFDNAFWDDESERMNFGDGQQLFPLTSLGISAHEVSHGFTHQHSKLNYEGESGGMNEAYSDMAAQAAEFYVYGKNNWLIGDDISKIDGETMRFMDQPSKDCFGKQPGTFCSIDDARQYYEGLNVHFSSGVYNRAFYLLSTTPGWDTRKAFAVMVQANTSYWYPETNFADGAACAVKAAEDLRYDKSAVTSAFSRVGIIVPDRCTNK